MSELSRSQFPPGGWQFTQPQTRWNAPTPISSTFDQTVNLIIAHRMKNPAITVKHNLSTDPVMVGVELENFNRARLGMEALGAASPKPLPPAAMPQMSGGVVAAVAAAKKLGAGAAILLEWELSGEAPVPAELAEKRAAVCAGMPCPKNDPASKLEAIFTVPVSEQIKGRLERLHALNLKTSQDEKLQVCSACLCPLKLKVHTPLHLVRKRLKDWMRAEWAPHCWILTEKE